MTDRRPPRPRCTECREWFRPASSAVGIQHVCSPACRAARDRKLAHERRELDLHAFRADERERQRACRARRKAAATPRVTGPPVTPGHAPPSVADPLQIQRKVLAAWDLEAARSRATLARLLTGFTVGLEGSLETSPPPSGPRSRATLLAQTPEITGDS